MASEVGSTLIMFIAAVGLAGLVAAGLTQAIGQMAISVDDRGEDLADAIGTDLALVNDPDNVPYDDGSNQLTLYVKNTGTKTLTDSELTILIDGQHESFDATVLNADRWSKGTVLQVTVSVDLDTGDHTARALYTPNIADTLEFRVG